MRTPERSLQEQCVVIWRRKDVSHFVLDVQRLKRTPELFPNPRLTFPPGFSTLPTTKTCLHAGTSGRVPAPSEKRFLINWV